MIISGMQFVLAAVEVSEKHYEHFGGMSTGEMWAMYAAMATVIGLLATIAFQAGKAHSKLSDLVPKVNHIHKATIEHAKTCDTDRALTNQTIQNHEGRIGSLEGT